MSGRFSATLAELRLQRTLIDQTIATLEMLNGERPLPSAVTSGPIYSAVAEETPRRKALPPPARRVGRGRPPKTERPAPKVQRPESRVQSRVHPAASVSDDDQVLQAIKQLAGRARMSTVLGATKLPMSRVARAKARLEKRGAIVVIGWARGARWSLPAPKEEP